MFWKKKDSDEYEVEDERYKTYEGYPGRVCPLCSRTFDDDSLFCRYDGQRLSIIEGKKLKHMKGVNDVKCMYCNNTVVPREDGLCPICRNVIVKSSSGLGKSIVLLVDQLFPVIITSFPYQFGRKDVARLAESELVNSKHLEFLVLDGKIKVRDSRSLNGTKLNDTIIGNHGRSFGDFDLKSGDSLELCLNSSDHGEIKMKVKING